MKMKAVFPEYAAENVSKENGITPKNDKVDGFVVVIPLDPGVA